MEHFCRDALAEHARLFRLWHKFRDGRIDRGQLRRRSIPIEQRLFAWASVTWTVPTATWAIFAPFCLTTFHGCSCLSRKTASNPPTTAPSANCGPWCRRAKSASETERNGELATARLFTVAETCRLQGLDVLDYLSAALSSHRRRLPFVPSCPGSPHLNCYCVRDAFSETRCHEHAHQSSSLAAGADIPATVAFKAGAFNFLTKQYNALNAAIDAADCRRICQQDIASAPEQSMRKMKANWFAQLVQNRWQASIPSRDFRQSTAASPPSTRRAAPLVAAASGLAR